MSAHPPYSKTAREIREAIHAFYQKPGNLAGGVLHVVLDDGNYHNDCLAHCRELAEEADDVDALEILDALDERSYCSRKRICP